ncbi:MAG: YfhO family protein [Acidobacteria bacterium]|nr:YfhO family protein [Acidobacteriota bacterium]
MLTPGPARTRDYIGVALLVVVMLGSLAMLFDRTWKRGERLSPADLVLTTFPWAADTTRITPKNPVRSDEAYYFQPIGVTHFARLRHGDFPDLDSSMLSGIPAFHHGLDVGRAYSPLSLPFYFFANDVATTLYAPLRLLAAALCMWWWLRWIGTGRIGAIAGSVAFGLNGAFMVWLSSPQPNVGLFLPLLALGADRIVERADRQGVAIFAVALGMMWIGGYTPTLILSSAAVGMLIAVALLARVHGAGVRAAGLPLVLLVVASVLGLAVGAVALFPTIANIASSSIVSRTMSDTLPWQNAATFVLPDFWGTPIRQNWWYAGAGNYSEFVSYLGVTTVVLAGAGMAAALGARDRRLLAVAGVALFALAAMYGVPPATWLSSVPPLRQVNPHRWHVVLAFALATMAAGGVDAVMTAEPGSRTRRVGVLAGMALAAIVAFGMAGLALREHLDDIRRLGLQAFERAQIVRAAQLAGVAILLATVAAWIRPLRALAGAGLVVVIAIDLVKGAYGFNPTLPPGQIFPPTPALERVREIAGDGRVAFSAEADTAWPTHVWGVYGLQTVDGFDFYGDPAYQQFMQRASSRPEEPAGWAYVEPGPPERLRVPLLNLLNVTAIATPPLDAVARGVGYAPLGELVDGRRVEQPFTGRFNGLRSIDVLTATYGRYNGGTFRVSLENDARARLATREIDAAIVPSNEWMRLEFAPIANSAGQRFWIVIEAHGATVDRAATVWMTGEPVEVSHRAVVDGRQDARSVWYRTFSSAPERIPGATLVDSGALNVYRGTGAMPRAWCVGLVEIAPLDQHLDRLVNPAFDPRQVAVLPATPAHPASDTAHVVSIDPPDGDARRIRVDAPDGGLLVVSERFHTRWSATVDGIETPILPANHLLLAVALPPGARDVVLEFRDPTRRPAEVVTILALAGIVLALQRRG